MRGFQLWINLPAKEKMRPAEYRDLEAGEIPLYESSDGFRIKVIAGRWQRGDVNLEGPITGMSTAPEFWDVTLPAGAVFDEVLPPGQHTYLYVFEGALEVGTSATALRARQGGILGEGERLQVKAAREGGRFLLLSAKPLGEPVVQHGPFVMNTREEIEQAIRDYQSGRLVAAR